MKILHILDHSLPLHSGYTFRSQNIFQCQRNRGWHPVVLTSPKHEESWKGNWSEKEEIDSFTYYRTGMVFNRGWPIESEIRIMSALYRRILEVVKHEAPSLIHAHSPVLNAIPAIKAGRKLGIPVVYEIRAFWEDAAVDHGTFAENSWKYWLIKTIETWVCRKADQITILCNGLKNDLVRRGIPPKKITTVFNGINPDDFKPCLPDKKFLHQWKLSGKKVIGFIGSFYRYEGLDLLVKVFSRLVFRRPNVALLLVGGGEMELEIKKMIKQNGLNGKVVMPGRIPHDKIPGIYAIFDILIYPRYSMRLTDLVTPLKPLEAMAMGKALVASDVGGHCELIRTCENGLLFSAGDTEALSEALVRMLDDDDLIKRLQSQSAAWVRKYHTWEKTTEVYQEIYRRALGQ
jgi:PEP-CTERM/exosortase A-associated glycosyltransferase